MRSVCFLDGGDYVRVFFLKQIGVLKKKFEHKEMNFKSNVITTVKIIYYVVTHILF